MNQVNYQKELEKTIAKIKEKGEIPSLLLHSCCAPCSSYVLEYLSDYFMITVFYYNPNIYPKSEYDKRLEEQKTLINNMKLKNEIGEALTKDTKVKYLSSDFKKNNGYKRSIELSKIYSLYRQYYCGCVFSKE